MKPGQTVYLCFSTDFLIEDADRWRNECWQMMRERSDLHFIFLTKRIDRFMDCIPADWKDGYDNVTVGCTIENQDRADYRLAIFSRLPIQHKNIICQPLIEEINLEPYLADVELVVVGGESDKYARPLDYEWVLKIRKQCIRHNVRFEFRQLGTHFIKGGKKYNILRSKRATRTASRTLQNLCTKRPKLCFACVFSYNILRSKRVTRTAFGILQNLCSKCPKLCFACIFPYNLKVRDLCSQAKKANINI